jgi:hypothetical protein
MQDSLKKLKGQIDLLEFHTPDMDHYLGTKSNQLNQCINNHLSSLKNGIK